MPSITSKHVYALIDQINVLRPNSVKIVFINTPDRHVVFHYYLFGNRQDKYTREAHEQLRGVYITLQAIIPPQQAPKFRKNGRAYITA